MELHAPTNRLLATTASVRSWLHSVKDGRARGGGGLEGLSPRQFQVKNEIMKVPFPSFNLEDFQNFQ